MQQPWKKKINLIPTRAKLKRLDDKGATGVWVSWNAYFSIVGLNLFGSSRIDSWML